MDRFIEQRHAARRPTESTDLRRVHRRKLRLVGGKGEPVHAIALPANVFQDVPGIQRDIGDVEGLAGDTRGVRFQHEPYGLADVWPDKIRGKTRIANPGCYPSAALTAIAPLIAAKLVDLTQPIIIDAKSGVSGAGRGGSDNKFGYAEVNEDVMAYGLLKHAHVPEITSTVNALAAASNARISFTPHLIPMTRGILATCYFTGDTTTEACMDAARKFYAGRPFVRVTDKPPHTKWATGSNMVFLHYAAAPGGPVIALAAIDNLGKGAAGQAVQNANLICGLDETAGIDGASLWP